MSNFLAVLALSALIVLSNASCFDDPTQPSCATFTMPDNMSQVDIKKNCDPGVGMPNMPACSIARLCDLEKKRGTDSGVLCTPFSEMKGTCQGMMKMAGCQDYAGLCRNGSVVKQCATPIFPTPTSNQLRTQVQSICQSMWMKECSQCLDQKKNPIPCDVFLVYSLLCKDMPDMDQCALWLTYCAAEPKWTICQGSGL